MSMTEVLLRASLNPTRFAVAAALLVLVAAAFPEIVLEPESSQHEAVWWKQDV
jgi:hypothetical protein